MTYQETGVAASNVVGHDIPSTASFLPAPFERERLIAEAAYFRAERRGFAPGGDMQDWLEAEAEIESRVVALPPNQVQPRSK